jgi:hypothetical protein
MSKGFSVGHARQVNSFAVIPAWHFSECLIRRMNRL